MKKLFLVFSLFCISAAMYSQLSLGIKGGMVVSNFSNIGTETKANIGYKIGIPVQYMFSQWGLQSGIFLSEVGTAYSEGSLPKKGGGSYLAIMEVSPKYFEIPLSFVYEYPIDDHVKLTMNLGGYYAYGYSGSGNIRYDNGGFGINTFDDISIKNNQDIADYSAKGANKTDYGLKFGFGINVYKFDISANYDLGLGNVYDQYPISTSSKNIKNRIFWIGIGYSFKL